MNYGVTLALVYLLIVITFFTPIVASTSADDQAIVNKIRADENHLRALVVILSLAGGLALSFGLGAGICLYWHLREFRLKKRLEKPTNASAAMIEDVAVDTAIPVIIVTPSSAAGTASAAGDSRPSSAVRALPPSPTLPQVLPPMVDTRVVNEGGPQPGPSAPSAKEILQQQEEAASAAAAVVAVPSLSSSSSHHQQQNYCCCHPPTPPPAYTPRTLNNLMHDPDVTPAVLFAIGQLE